MIDIQKLKQFPLSFKAFEGYIEKQYGNVLFIYNGIGVVKNEDIVDFLDLNSVFVSIDINGSACKSKIRSYEYQSNGITSVEKREVFNIKTTRRQHESEAIQVAFELLERKLKTN